jgi:glycosyltransferase involved in cell wall biosynthesis
MRNEAANNRSMMSVRFVTRKWAPAMGGMETYCERLTGELAKRHTVDVIALAGKADGLTPGALSIIFFGISSSFKLLFRRSADVYHFGDMAIWPLAWITRFRHRSAKYVISAHGTDVSYPLRGGLLGGLYGWYLRLGARLSPELVVIANSRATADACKLAHFADVNVVRLATDMRRAGSTISEPGHLLFAGRLIRQKGAAWFVENVLPLLPESIIVRVAGTVWDQEEGKILHNPRVKFLGKLTSDALGQSYADALCVIVPNIDVDTNAFEGFGLVATEAAAAGGVVVASFHSGLKDALLNDLTGFHVPAGNAQKWAEKITEIAAWDKNRREKFIVQSVAAIDAHYRWDRVARETELLY